LKDDLKKKTISQLRGVGFHSSIRVDSKKIGIEQPLGFSATFQDAF